MSTRDGKESIVDLVLTFNLTPDRRPYYFELDKNEMRGTKCYSRIRQATRSMNRSDMNQSTFSPSLTSKIPILLEFILSK